MQTTLCCILAVLVAAANTAVATQIAPLNCDLIECPDEVPVCEDDEELRVPPGQCCQVCMPRGFVDCSFVLCLAVECGPNQRVVVPEGECCGRCEPIDKCLGVPCALPLCTQGLTPTVPEGECCPKCPDCSDIFCIQVACQLPRVPIIPPGECCPRCELDCSAVSCLKPICRTGETLVTPEGECCPVCQRDCSAVSCVIPVCPTGQVARVLEGECCPVCECEIQGQTFSKCASACPRTCENPNIFCRAQCRPGCQCPDYQVIDTQNRKCVPAKKCPPSCPIRGQVFQTCSTCPVTCIDVINKDLRLCPAVCRPGCGCPPGQVIDSINGDCLTPDECPNPCERFECGANARCKLYPPTGEPFCEQSCAINNGGCAANQECSLQEVQCMQAPCPPVVRCTHTGPCRVCRPNQTCIFEPIQCLVPPCPQATPRCLEPRCTLPAEVGPCDAAIPRFFYNVDTRQCERFTFGGCQGNENNFKTLQECQRTCNENSLSPCAAILCPNGFRCEVENGEGFCQPDCSISNGGCPPNTTCRLQPVQCVRAPCPPARLCEDPCALIDCDVGFRCEVFNGKGFCRADCSLNNGGCPRGQICELQEVVCITAPCFPVRVCKPDCPPQCSREVCENAPPGRICSNPGPREIPGCTGPCQISYCRLCYFSDEGISPTPGDTRCRRCEDLSDYTSNSRCYRRWSRCTNRAHRRRFGRVDFSSKEQLRCYNPPCPLRG